MNPRPRWVFLFSGHMVDGAGRDPPRFPDKKSPLASDAILEKLNQLGANEADLGICGGACGGDLLFAELCLDRGMALQLYLPFQEPLFLEKSVNFAGEAWIKRYYRVKNHSKTMLSIMTDELSSGQNPYGRNNLRMLYNALTFGADKVRLIALWDGKAGDGPGGTKDMIEAVKKQLGQVWILDTKQLFA